MQRPDFALIAALGIERCPEGKAVTEFKPGGFILTDGHSFFSPPSAMLVTTTMKTNKDPADIRRCGMKQREVPDVRTAYPHLGSVISFVPKWE